MARNVEAFKERIEISIDNARANAALQQTVKHVENLSGGFKGMLGAFSREAKDSIEKVEGLTGSFGKLSSVLGGLGGGSITSGPLGIVAGGLGAIGTAAAGAAVGLFTLAEKSSEIGKNILEIHEKANLSTEAISAFRVAAEQIGTPFELVGNKLAGFSVAMGKAQLGNKAMIQVFKDMGVSLHQGVEPALAQFIQRFDQMGPSAKRSALEAQLFRDRTGALIPVLEQLGGSLDEAKKKAAEMGLSFTEEDAKAAAEFSKTWKMLELQFMGVAEGFSKQYMPEIVDSMKGFSKGLKDNQGVIKEWGQSVADSIRGVKAIAHSALGQLFMESEAWTLKWLTLEGLIYTGLGAMGKAERPPGVLKTQTRAESFKNISDRFVKLPDITPPDNADVKEKKAKSGRASRLGEQGETPAEFHAAMGKFIAALNAMGETTTLISGGRTTAQQQSIWDRRDPKTGLFHGNPVAPPGTSMHERNLAADLSFRGPMSQESIGRLAESMGITWGGRFSKPDPGHFQAGKGLGAGVSAIQNEIDKLTKTYDDYLLRLDKEAAELKLSDTAYAQHRGIFKEEQVALDLTGDAYKNLSKSQKDAIIAKAKEVGETERASAAARTFADFIANQKKELDQLSGAQRTATSDVDDFQAASIKAGAAIDPETLALMRQNAVLIDTGNRWAQLGGFIRAAVASMNQGWQSMDDAFEKAGEIAEQSMGKIGTSVGAGANVAMGALGRLAAAMGQIAGFAPQQQVSKKRGLFSKILGMAAPFLAFIPGVGPILSTLVGAASGFVGGNISGGISALAGGFASGGSISNLFRPTGPTFKGALPGPGTAGKFTGRALGGPVYAGTPYIVGEHRPELFVPHTDGRIIPQVPGGELHPAHAALLDRVAAALERLETMSPGDMVARGAHGLISRMNSDSGFNRKMGQRLNFG